MDGLITFLRQLALISKLFLLKLDKGINSYDYFFFFFASTSSGNRFIPLREVTLNSDSGFSPGMRNFSPILSTLWGVGGPNFVCFGLRTNKLEKS